MTAIIVTKTLLLDPVALAETLESRFGLYLIPAPSGFYLPGETKPAMEENQYYYKYGKSASGKIVQMAVTELKHVTDKFQLADGTIEVTSDVYNNRAEIVIPCRKARSVCNGPSIPIQGLAIVQAFINKYIDDASAWIEQRTRVSAREVLEPFLLPPYRDFTIDKNADIANELTGALYDVQKDVNDFIQEDAWVMHFQRLLGWTTIMIEKTIDFRIYDWERRMKQAEWNDE